MSDAAAAAPKKSKKGLFMILAVLLLGGGGAGAYFFYFKAPAAQAKGAHEEGEESADEAEHEEEAEEPEEEGEEKGIVPMAPFVVNLADPGGSRFLRVTLTLVVKNEEVAKEIEENAVETAQIRSGILELLSQQQSEALVTPEGKDELKQAIAERVKQAVRKVKVSDVLFSEFVIQF
jgi:flagellar protein FliL